MNIFKTKTQKQIEDKYRGIGYLEAKEIYEEMLLKERKGELERTKKLKESYEEIMKREIRKIKEELEIKIDELSEENKQLKLHVLRARKAWNLFKEFIPRALDMAHLLKSDAEMRAEAESKRMGILRGYEGSIEYMQIQIDKMTPKIEGLLGE